MDPDKEWPRKGACSHNWRTGPLTDRLLRARPAVCVKCWTYEPHLPLQEARGWPQWTEGDAERYTREVEEHFGGEVRTR